MLYLFIGQDSPSKDEQLKKIRQEFLPKDTEQFNFDKLAAEDLTLKALQERLLFLPVKNSKRIVLIKGAQDLKNEAKEFILEYIQKPYKHLILILDFNQQAKDDAFLGSALRYSKVFRFNTARPLDTFALSRQITLRRPDLALRVLNQLLIGGERPERILGGLRYVWENEVGLRSEMSRRLKLLLNCDIDIKTGRLKPAFALEKLVISLCGSRGPLH